MATATGTSLRKLPFDTETFQAIDGSVTAISVTIPREALQASTEQRPPATSIAPHLLGLNTETDSAWEGGGWGRSDLSKQEEIDSSDDEPPDLLEESVSDDSSNCSASSDGSDWEDDSSIKPQKQKKQELTHLDRKHIELELESYTSLKQKQALMKMYTYFILSKNREKEDHLTPEEIDALLSTQDPELSKKLKDLLIALLGDKYWEEIDSSDDEPPDLPKEKKAEASAQPKEVDALLSTQDPELPKTLKDLMVDFLRNGAEPSDSPQEKVESEESKIRKLEQVEYTLLENYLQELGELLKAKALEKLFTYMRAPEKRTEKDLLNDAEIDALLSAKDMELSKELKDLLKSGDASTLPEPFEEIFDIRFPKSNKIADTP